MKKNEVRMAMMKECREHYSIFAEDEKRAIVWANGLTERMGVTYVVDKVNGVVCMLVPLYHAISFKGDIVRYDGNEVLSDGMYWRDCGNQVIELPSDTKDHYGKMLYGDFLK